MPLPATVPPVPRTVPRVVLKLMLVVPPANVALPVSEVVEPTFRTPPLTVVPPVYELEPVRVTVPEPVFVRAAAPFRFALTVPLRTLIEPETVIAGEKEALELVIVPLMSVTDATL